MAARKLCGTPPKVVWTISPDGGVRSRPMLSGCHDQIVEYAGDRLPPKYQDRGAFSIEIRPAAQRLGWCLLATGYELDSRPELSEPATREFVEEQIKLYLLPGDSAQAVERKKDEHARLLRELTGKPRGFVVHQAFNHAAQHDQLERVEQVEYKFPPDVRKTGQRPLVLPQFPTSMLPELALYRRSKQTKHVVSVDGVSAPNLGAAAEADEAMARGMSNEALALLKAEAAEAIGAAGGDAA